MDRLLTQLVKDCPCELDVERRAAKTLKVPLDSLGLGNVKSILAFTFKRTFPPP